MFLELNFGEGLFYTKIITDFKKIVFKVRTKNYYFLELDFVTFIIFVPISRLIGS